ncbi:hypothetical protein LJC05_00810 [Bacteroides sp. OttesenSCG-928-J23]|nr:hypothetical protein [Bacteroides sp. OttesenSCG-928-J23]MDL2299508.1 hypothetical protein [Bacteroides sp. OttesenSCG-928-E20]
MKHLIKTLATATAIVAMLFTSCSGEELRTNTLPEDNKTPITVGKLVVAGSVLPSTRGGAQRAEGSTRAVGNWGDTYDPFSQDDELAVTSGATTVIYQYQADGTWDIEEGKTPFYKEDLEASPTFTAAKGIEALVEDQSTLALYRGADRITGDLKLSGNQLVNANAPNDKLTHQHIDVVVIVKPAAGSTHWDGKDFMAHMQDPATTVTFHTNATGKNIAPFCSTITPQAVTYRAVMPLSSMPADGSKIVTITAPKDQTLEVKYTLENGATLAAGKRLAISIDYDNKRTLTVKATVDAWKQGPDYEVEHNGYDMVIRTKEDLHTFAKLVNEGKLYSLTAIQVADIDLEKKEWTPIGTGANPYKGIYNGGGYKIAGLTIDASAKECQGLFGKTSGATLTGINFIDPSVAGSSNVGALTGYAENNTHISNCSITGGTITIASNGSAGGGLVGYNTSIIVACYAKEVTINGGVSHQAGLVGLTAYGLIYFCYATENTPAKLVGNPGASYSYSCYDDDATNDTNETGNIPATPDRSYAGNITIRTGISTTRTIDKSIWGPGNQPSLEW